MNRKTILGALLSAAALSLGLSNIAWAQYPNRPVKMVVPYPPGATNDLLARVLAEPLAKELGQNIIVDNRDGAAGIRPRRR